MGTCMSKGHKKKFKQENFNHVDDDDKIVISQSLANIALSPSKSPLSITSISSSLSSSNSCISSEFSIASSGSSLSSSSSSWSSLILSSKERSFSNEFLRSCANENPHVVGLDSIRESSEKSSMSKRNYPQKMELSPSKREMQVKQSINQERLGAGSTSTLKKRSRNNNSPIVERQKSLRKEGSSPNYVSNRAIRTPSPGRRFNMESPRRVSSLSADKTRSESSQNKGFIFSGKSNNLANKDLNRRNSSFKSKETTIQQIDAKTAETKVGEMQAKKMDIDSLLIPS